MVCSAHSQVARSWPPRLSSRCCSSRTSAATQLAWGAQPSAAQAQSSVAACCGSSPPPPAACPACRSAACISRAMKASPGCTRSEASAQAQLDSSWGRKLGSSCAARASSGLSCAAAGLQPSRAHAHSALARSWPLAAGALAAAASSSASSCALPGSSLRAQGGPGGGGVVGW
jgi:hypothetical protein